MLSFAGVHSQDTSSLAYAEVRMKGLLEEIGNAGDENRRLELNRRFTEAICSQLEKKGSFSYPFDSLKGITSVTSPDGRFRMFTWPVLLADGRFRFSGILQVPDKKAGRTCITVFTDRGDSIPDPERAVLAPEKWFGAVYYQVIPILLPGGGKAYTLLGWRGLGLLVSSRLIEVMTLGPDGTVSFGSNLFCEKEQLPDTRIIFRYSAKASMVLTYEKQAVVTGKKWNASSRELETERIRETMIVCDRIVPMDPQMEGRYEYYVPASDVMDGYLYRNGCWSLVREVDARNPYQKPKALPKNPDK
jgi:hypothetical protein